MLQAIIFDVDGTLAETEEVHRAAFNQAFAEAGLGWHWNEDLYRELLKVTGGKERIASFIESAGGLGMRPVGVETLIADLHRRKTAIYAELLAGGSVKPRPGVAGLIEGALIDGIRLAIATTTSRPNVDALLIAILGAGSPSAFEVIAAGDSVAAKKPAPDIFLAALSDLRLQPRDCLAIEDSQNGLRAATGCRPRNPRDAEPLFARRGFYRRGAGGRNAASADGHAADRDCACALTLGPRQCRPGRAPRRRDERRAGTGC